MRDKLFPSKISAPEEKNRISIDLAIMNDSVDFYFFLTGVIRFARNARAFKVRESKFSNLTGVIFSWGLCSTTNVDRIEEK